MAVVALGMIASPAGFVERRAGKRLPIAELVRRAEALEARGFVVGLPLDANGGRVRIGGEEWSARSYMEDGVFEPGARVEVAKIEGATALVYE